MTHDLKFRIKKYNINSYMINELSIRHHRFINNTLKFNDYVGIIKISTYYQYRLQMRQSQQQYLRGSLITHETRPSRCYSILTKLDFFAFIPVPKDIPVSTKPSLIGSILFIIVALSYTILSFYFFVTDNPPTIETYSSKLDNQFYQLPRISFAFMSGKQLNQTQLYEQYFNFTMTKEQKSFSTKLETQIPLVVNDPVHKQWLTPETAEAYKILRSPNQSMMAKGLLYSSGKCNYTKLLVSMCNINQPGDCQNISKIRSLCAKGRIFLFIQDKINNASVSKETEQDQNKFRLANFFLQPGIYKRAVVSFKIIKTQIFPDYLTRFSREYTVRLTLQYVTQQSSNTSINDQQQGRVSLEMLGISFQLSPQIEHVRMTYLNIFDYISKWGAFLNVMFTVWALVLLGFNRRKFYQKNPQWDRFRAITRRKLKNSELSA